MKHPQSRLLGHHDPIRDFSGIRYSQNDEHRLHDRDNGIATWVLLLRLRGRRTGHKHRLRLYHPVLTPPATSAPVRRSPRPSKTGPGTNIISGMAVGFENDLCHRPYDSALRSLPATGSARTPASAPSVASSVPPVATMGMLMTTAYVLAMDTFGPITDNAGASPSSAAL